MTLVCSAMVLVPADRWPDETEVHDIPPETEKTGEKMPTVEETAVAVPQTNEEPFNNASMPQPNEQNGVSASETVISTPDPPKKTRAPLRPIITSTPFILSCVLIFLMPFGSMAPAYYGAAFSTSVLGLSSQTAAFPVSILNIASTLGRVVQGSFAEYTGGPATNLAISVFLAGLLQLIWWPNVTSQASMSAYMFFQGFVGGSYNGVLSQVIAANFDPNVVATALSMSYSFFTYVSLASAGRI